MKGIIPAGGQATRLGPLAAYVSKVLVSIGGRPQLINLVEQMRRAGCDDIVVVTSPDTDTQVRSVIERSGLERVKTAVQGSPSGPMRAIGIGMAAVYDNIDCPMMVIMADTYINEELPNSEFIGVSTGGSERNWCYSPVDKFVDGRPDQKTQVFVGAFRLNSMAESFLVAQRHIHDNGMAEFLNEFSDVQRVHLASWQDVGDVLALGKARRERFISRAHHRLVLDDTGMITKIGCTEQEAEFMCDLNRSYDATRACLFPRVYEVKQGPTSCQYTMDYIDLPSLAELWLYWPGLPETWAGIVQSVVERCKRDLWTEQGFGTVGDTYKFYGEKAVTRLASYLNSPIDSATNNLVVNACEIIRADTWVNGHGDLNFTNILYSLNTNNIKLIDPRGGRVPVSYEYAKLACSHMISSIMHGLTNVKRDAEQEAVLSVLHKYIEPNRLKACMALTMLAAASLHKKDEAYRFYQYGMQLLQEVTQQ